MLFSGWIPLLGPILALLLDRPIGGVWDVYELLPAFLFFCILIVVVSLLSAPPSEEIQKEFDEVRMGKVLCITRSIFYHLQLRSYKNYDTIRQTFVYWILLRKVLL